jgi:hypothetical protein
MKTYTRRSLEIVLIGLEERARDASEFDKDAGDRWHINHSYVINSKHTICLPTWEPKGSILGFPPSDNIGATNAFGRHIAGTNPHAILRLVATIRELIADVK